MNQLTIGQLINAAPAVAKFESKVAQELIEAMTKSIEYLLEENAELRKNLNGTLSSTILIN
ncbi:hypothetical protein [Siccibacter turicensis]|uniref:hypothetical protein n=1 Tax=Siccibacter turicensis TaxID=357233 RepID=UPI00101ECE1B|nr:hypothetical protein [Siccibacter turicensis]